MLKGTTTLMIASWGFSCFTLLNEES